MQAVNNYEKDVYNGDPGYISEIDPKARRVVVNYPSTSSGSPKPTPLPLINSFVGGACGQDQRKLVTQNGITANLHCHPAELCSAHSLFLQPYDLPDIIFVGSKIILPQQC